MQTLSSTDLKTKEYKKQELWKNLGLTNLKQKVCLSTLNGNDYINFESLETFHRSLSTQWKNPKERFPAIANYIKENFKTPSLQEIVERIAFDAFKPENRKDGRVKINASIDMYELNFEVTPLTDPIEKFCVDKLKKFIYSILKRDVAKFPLLYFDLRNDQIEKLYKTEMELFTKQAGIILKHKNEANEANERSSKKIKLTSPDPLANCALLKVIAKRTLDGSYSICKVEPDYPLFDLPPLNELLSPEEFENHNEVRWKLLQWAIQITKDEITKMPGLFIHDILTLNFMRKSGFIEVFEADLFLLSIKMSRDENHDKKLDKIPDTVNKGAFQLSFLFTNFRSRIMRTLSVCGLERFKKLIDFDGVIFHNLYSNYPTLSENATVIEQLGDLKNHRIYAQPISTSSKNPTI